jgi:hypothetical protein
MDDTNIEDFELEALSQYRYFDRWYRIELALFVLFGPLLVTLWSVIAWYYHHSDRLPAPILKPAVYVTVAFLFARIFYRNFGAIARSKTVVIDGEKVSKRNAGKINAFNLAEISGVRLPEFPLPKRWMILETFESKGTFLLPVYIRNGHRMIDRIFKIMEEKGLRVNGAANMRDRLYNAARRYNVLQKMRAKQMHNMFLAAAAVAFLSAAAVLVYWERGLLMALAWGFINMLLQTAAYFTVETAHLKRLLKSDGKAGEDTAFAGYYVLGGLSALLIGMTAGIFITEPM